jgi:hypothetical protein
MAKRRSLKSATADPLVEKEKVTRVTVKEQEAAKAGNTARRVGTAVVAAAVVVGFIGGWLARRWLRLP